MAKKVAPLSDGLRWSKARLSAVTGFSRETIARKLEDGGVEPSGIEQKHPVWNPRTALPVLYDADTGQSAFTDPNKMTTKERKDWFDSERIRLVVEREQGVSVDINEYINRVSGILQTVAALFDRMPHDMERKLQWPPEQTAAFDAELDRTRRSLQSALIEMTEKEDATG